MAAFDLEFSALQVVPLTPAIVAAFFVFLGYTPSATLMEASQVSVLVQIAMRSLDTELAAVATEGKSGSTTSMDPVLQVAEGPERVRKKTLADRLYARIVELYPEYSFRYKPDKMLSPTLVFEFTDSLRRNVHMGQSFNLMKLDTYAEVKRADNGQKANVDTGGRITLEDMKYNTSFVNNSMGQAMENVNILLFGLLAAVSFHIGPNDRDGTSGYTPGYANRLFGTRMGFTQLEGRVTAMSIHYSEPQRFCSKWATAIIEIFRRVMNTSNHFDDIVSTILDDDKYFCAASFHKVEGKRNRGQGRDEYAGYAGDFNGNLAGPAYGCGDLYFGRQCRHGGPPPHGICKYDHSPGAMPSPKLLGSVSPGMYGPPMMPPVMLPPPPSGGAGVAPVAGSPGAGAMVVGAPPPPPGMYNMYPPPGMGYGYNYGQFGGRGRGKGRGRGRARH